MSTSVDWPVLSIAPPKSHLQPPSTPLANLLYRTEKCLENTPCLTLSSPGFLHVPSVRGSQQPLPAEQVLTTWDSISILYSIDMSTELRLLLGFGDEAETVLEAVSVGQVRCCLSTGVP